LYCAYRNNVRRNCCKPFVSFPQTVTTTGSKTLPTVSRSIFDQRLRLTVVLLANATSAGAMRLIRILAMQLTWLRRPSSSACTTCLVLLIIILVPSSSTLDPRPSTLPYRLAAYTDVTPRPAGSRRARSSRTLTSVTWTAAALNSFHL